MTIYELDKKYRYAKEKADNFAELAAFWKQRLDKTLEAEVREEQFDSDHIIDLINSIASDFYDMDIDIRDKNRKRQLAWARSFYCNHIKTYYPSVTLKTIGHSINRNHATVINSLHSHNDLLHDYEYRKFVEAMEERVVPLKV